LKQNETQILLQPSNVLFSDVVNIQGRWDVAAEGWLLTDNAASDDTMTNER
jgi:hypothetical protein